MPWHPKTDKNELYEAPVTIKLVHYKGNDDDYHNSKTITSPTADLDHVQRYLVWKPMDVAKKTLKATTQLVQNHVKLPMRMPFNSRYPALKVKRYREPFATDTCLLQK